jgi:hypothetical protein
MGKNVMARSTFDSPAIRRRIVREVARIKSKLLEWTADPVEGGCREKIVQVLVETLDAHAQAYLGTVEEEDQIPEYLARLRHDGMVLIQNAKARSILSDPYSEGRLRKIAESSGEYQGKKHLLTPERQEQELMVLIERARVTLSRQAMEWRAWKNDILIEVDTRFEARYLHWRAEAMEQVEGRSHLRPTTELQVARWEEIEVVFLSDERVQIAIGEQLATHNYAELGFTDHRNGKPNRAWAMLRVLAAAAGTIENTASTKEMWPNVERRIQEIRKTLRNHFQLGNDPVPFIDGTGYRTRFRILLAPSFTS